MGEATGEQTRELEKLEQAAEEASEPQEIQKTAESQPKRTVRRGWFVPYVVVAGLLGLSLFVLDWQAFRFAPSTLEKIRRYLLGALGIAVLLTVARGVEVYAISRVRNAVSRFNLKRILRLLVAVIFVFIVVSVLFVNWYTAVVGLGLVSLVLGFALQTPISSFIGWIYILLRAPYRVGDRIEIGEARGDVIDVGYLDTTLWEIGGRHLSTDHPSGRLIKFPNTNVFSTPVFNYSWPLFPYVWYEIKFHIAYDSDLEFVSSTMQRITEEDLGESMMEKVKVFRSLLARTPVDHLKVHERPNVIFRVSENTWLEAIVRYLVPPKEAGETKTRLTGKLLAALNAAPDKVLFPKSNLR
jgi:small-conductance mechanosensitive channel